MGLTPSGDRGGRDLVALARGLMGLAPSGDRFPRENHSWVIKKIMISENSSNGRVQRQIIGGARIQKVRFYFSIFGLPRENHFWAMKKIMTSDFNFFSTSQLLTGFRFFLTRNTAQEWSKNTEREFSSPHKASDTIPHVIPTQKRPHGTSITFSKPDQNPWVIKGNHDF